MKFHPLNVLFLPAAAVLLEPVVDVTAFFFSPVLVELPVGKDGGKVFAFSLCATLLCFDMSLNSLHCSDLTLSAPNETIVNLPKIPTCTRCR